MPIPANPTWQEIQDGMQAAVNDAKAALAEIKAQEAALATAQEAIRAQQAVDRQARKDYEAWSKAIRKKLIAAAP